MIHPTNYNKYGKNNKRREQLLQQTLKPHPKPLSIPVVEKASTKVPEEVPVNLPFEEIKEENIAV